MEEVRPFLDSVKARDRRDRARGLPGGEDGNGPRVGRRRSCGGARALDGHAAVGVLRRGVRARGGVAPDWPEQGAELVWESTPGGRGQGDRAGRRGWRGRGLPTRCSSRRWWARRRSPPSRSAGGGAQVELRLDYELTRYGPRAPSPTCCSSAGRSATRCGARSAASQSRRTRRPACGSLPDRRKPGQSAGGARVRVQSRRGRGGDDGRGDRPGDRPPGFRPSSRTSSRSSSTRALRRRAR